MNKSMFEKLLTNSKILDDDNLNPLSSDHVEAIQHKTFKKDLNCI